MSARRQKPIGFAAEGLRLALAVDRNCEIPVQTSVLTSISVHCFSILVSSALNSSPCLHETKRSNRQGIEASDDFPLRNLPSEFPPRGAMNASHTCRRFVAPPQTP